MSEHTKGDMKISDIGTIRLGRKIVGTIWEPGSNQDQKEFVANCKRFSLCWNNYEATAAHRDKLLTACEIGLSYINAEISGVPRPISDLQDDKETAKSAIAGED